MKRKSFKCTKQCVIQRDLKIQKYKKSLEANRLGKKINYLEQTKFV